MKKISVVLVLALILLFSGNALAEKKLTMFWDFMMNDDYLVFLGEAIAQFEKENNVKVEFHKMRSTYTDNVHDIYLKILSTGNSTPDIIKLDGIRVPEFAALGYIVDVSGSFGEYPDFLPNSLKEATWNNKIWGFPYYAPSGAIFYRKDILASQNISPPKTWAELVQTSLKLQQKDIKGFVGQMANYEALICNVLEYMWSFGGQPDFVTPANIVTQNNIDALSFMYDLLNKYKITPDEQLNYREQDGIQLFREGKVIFMRQWPGTWMNPNDKQWTTVLFNTGMVGIPAGGSQAKGSSTYGGWVLAVNKKSKNTNLAVKLSQFLTNKENQKRNMMEWSYIPTRRSLYSDTELTKKFPWLSQMYDIQLNAKLRPRTPYYPEIAKIMRDEFYLALQGKITPKRALERVEEKLTTFKGSIKNDH